MKKRNSLNDYLKASRRGSREAELEMFGHPVPRAKIHKSKKTYNRKGEKAALKKLPFDFLTSNNFTGLCIGCFTDFREEYMLLT